VVYLMGLFYVVAGVTHLTTPGSQASPGARLPLQLVLGYRAWRYTR
jgi:hypothetical protein